MTTAPVTPAAAKTFPLFKSYNGLTREDVAHLFTQAARVIQNQGWTAYPDYEGETGTDIEGALKIAAGEFTWTAYARAPRQGEVSDLADELTGRLGGVMHLAGIDRYNKTGSAAVYDFQTDAAEGSCTKWARYRTAADMIGLLNLAAQLICLLPE